MESYEVMREHARPVDTTDLQIRSVGTPMSVGKRKNELLTTLPELHSFVIGESGSGKTRRVIYPMVRLLSRSGDSMIISDPKGEIHRNTAAYLKKAGYEVLVLNFRSPRESHHWNPLGNIDKNYHSGDPVLKEQAITELKEITELMKAGIQVRNDSFWETQSGQIILGLAEIIMEYGDPGDLSFFNVQEAFLRFNALRILNERRSISPDTEIKRLLERWFEQLPKDSKVRSNLQSLYEANEHLRSNLTATVMPMLAPYTNQEGMRELFRKSDFALNCFGKKPTALFIILPDDSQVMYHLATMLVDQIYKQLVYYADKECGGVLPVKTHFILDEFANFAVIPDMPSMLTASRSRGIVFTLVCQSMEQLIAKYQQEGAEILMANCRVWIYMNCRNLPFLKRLSELAGNAVTEYSELVTPLFTVSELAHLSPGEVVVFNDRCNAYRGYLNEYSEIDFGEKKLPPTEKFPKTAGRKHRFFDFDLLLKRAAGNDLELELVTTNASINLDDLLS